MKKSRYQEHNKTILSAVHMVYRLVNSTYNVRELSLRLTRLLCQFVRAQSCSLYILDPAKKKIILVSVFTEKKNFLIERRKQLDRTPSKIKKVTEGVPIFEKHLMALPLVADDNIGALLVERQNRDAAFVEFDKQMISVFAEQAVTAIKNLQLHERQQKIILGSIQFIKNLIEKHGHPTPQHAPLYSKVISHLAMRLNISQAGIENLQYASLLHDAGSVEVPFEILAKSSQLTREEFKIIRNHPAKCVELIKPVEFLKPILPIILYHHEKYDGTGYPSGLKKEQIPLGARIMAVVDAFEAMTRGRPYKKTVSIDEAIAELKRHRGTQFDPKVVDALADLAKQKKFRKYLSLIKH